LIFIQAFHLKQMACAATPTAPPLLLSLTAGLLWTAIVAALYRSSPARRRLNKEELTHPR
jgi:hypothetical protein